MKFAWFITRKVSLDKSNKKNLSQIIIKIGQIAVCLGIIISIITISVGIGSKKKIKESLSDFNGHIVIKNLDTNNSFNTSLLKNQNIDFNKINSIEQVKNIQKFATKSGVIRTEKSFEGVILKGYSSDFDSERFNKFIVSGHNITYSDKEFSNDVLISEKIANNLELNPNDSFIMYFISYTQKPIYRKFNVKGIFKTNIKDIDQNFIIGDLKHVQHLNKWQNNQIGGYEIFIKDIEQLDYVSDKISNYIGYESILIKSTETYSSIINWINLFDTNIYVIISIMLLVVIINLIMVLLILIIERTHFIGILKTLGASNFKIQLIFVNYTLFIMVPGLISGNLIAISLLLIQKYFGIIKLNPDNYFFDVVPIYFNLIYFSIISLGLFMISLIILLIPSFIISRIYPNQVLKFD